MSDLQEKQATLTKTLGAAVVTPVGIYPADGGFARAQHDEVIEHFLKQAAKALDIPDTKDWVAHVAGRKIDVHRTFHEEDLQCVVDIDWHQHGGGGGA